jgi:hypothetical protein
MRQRQEYKTCYPNVTLAPDWDLTEAIHDSNRHLTELPKYRHVLGHQDKMTHYAQLPLTAQLNVDADEATGAFHWSHSTTIQANVALLSTTKAHLRIGNTTITGQYKHHIRRAALTAEFFKQCRAIHNWEETTLHSIQLDSFRTATHNSVHRHKFIFKYVHNLLPTQERKSLYGEYSPHCPSCHEIDDHTHFLRCTCTDQSDWRTSSLRKLRSYLESSQTNFELMTVILEAITAWLTGGTISSTDYPSRCRRAINAQTVIGWHEFLQGYWAKEWSLLQDAHLRNTSQWTHKSTSQTWATRTITTLWEYAQPVGPFTTTQFTHKVKKQKTLT